MKHQDKELKMYAENGLRSAEDWASLGRVGLIVETALYLSDRDKSP